MGGDVAFESIRIEITPSVATRKLQLDQGAFDLVTKGFAIPDVLTYQDNPEFTVATVYGGVGQAMWLNPNHGMFADKELRQATCRAIDRKPIVETSFGGLVDVQAGLWLDPMFPPELAPVSDDVDTDSLIRLVADLPSKEVDLAWGQDGGAPVQQMAELVQTQLAACGLEVTVREMPSARRCSTSSINPRSAVPTSWSPFSAETRSMWTRACGSCSAPEPSRSTLHLLQRGAGRFDGRGDPAADGGGDELRLHRGDEPDY